MASLSDHLEVSYQYLLPKRSLCRLMHAATRLRVRWWKNALIRWFVRHYGVDMSLAQKTDPRAYEHFNAFFTRALKAGARPLAQDLDAILCPVDGTLSEAGPVKDGRLIQAKDRHYGLDMLLGGSRERAAVFQNGSYATFYLSPRDYHRIHMPLRGQLREMIYVPGRLFSVNAAASRTVRELFGRNERVVSVFDTPAGPMALVLVGALFVASIETVWAGTITPPRSRRIRRWDYTAEHSPPVLERGEEMGRFNMGSTVIVLFGPGRARWDIALGTKVAMGQQIGTYY
ncbi:MAG: archaetidylserine decarboxylase [Rudaea sp.]